MVCFVFIGLFIVSIVQTVVYTYIMCLLCENTEEYVLRNGSTARD
jgi:hypothetical protein